MMFIIDNHAQRWYTNPIKSVKGECSMIKKSLRTLVLLLCLAAILLSLCACGSVEKKLTESWYKEKTGSLAFTLYSDGDCDIYGLFSVGGGSCPGDWSIVNKNILKLSPLLYETITYEIQDITTKSLTVTDANGNTIIFWNTEEEAKAHG
jgi:hypothetical protein